MKENLIRFARKCDDDNFFRKILQLLQENLTVFPGNSNDFCTKLWRSLQEHLTIFQKNLIFAVKSADFYFQVVNVFFITIILIQVKLVRFYCKNLGGMWITSIQFHVIYVLWGECVSVSFHTFNFPEEFVKFFCNYQPSNLSVEIINFPHKNIKNFPAKIFKFSYKTC